MADCNPIRRHEAFRPAIVAPLTLSVAPGANLFGTSVMDSDRGEQSEHDFNFVSLIGFMPQECFLGR